MTDRGLQQGLPRAERLRKRSGFLAVQARGRRLTSRSLVLYAMPGADGVESRRARLGITVSKKVGKAVVRNRVKRWLRESYRRLPEAKQSGLDLVFIAKPSAGASTFHETQAEVERLIRSLRTR